jgi:hypothetical protein
MIIDRKIYNKLQFSLVSHEWKDAAHICHFSWYVAAMLQLTYSSDWSHTMKTSSTSSLVLMFAVFSVTCSSSVFAGGWECDAGAKGRGEIYPQYVGINAASYSSSSCSSDCQSSEKYAYVAVPQTHHKAITRSEGRSSYRINGCKKCYSPKPPYQYQKLDPPYMYQKTDPRRHQSWKSL